MKKSTLRIVIYARFSSDNQREESIDAQVRACEDYIKHNKGQLVKIYIDRAKSATTDMRPEFQQMIADSGQNLFDAVLVHKLDRFSRQKFDSVFYKRKLKQNGVSVISATERLDGSPESDLMETVLEGLAQYYSQNLGREVMKGMNENALKCQHTGGIPALGYDVDPITRHYIINECEAETVREIFRLYLDGYGYDRMVDILNAKGHLTKRKRPFGKNSLHDILANEKYSGTYIFNRASSKDCDGRRNNHESKENDHVIRIPGGVPAIITMEEFQKAQLKMQQNKRQPGSYRAKEMYLLSGLIICGECLEQTGERHAMMGNVKYSGRVKTKHVTYRCGNRERTKQCTNKELRREYIENYVLSELEKRIFNDQAIPLLVKKLNDYQDKANDERNKELPRLKAALAEVEIQIKNIVDALVQGRGKETLTAKLDELEESKANMQVAMQKIDCKQKKTVISADVLKGLFSMFHQFVTERNIPEIKKFIGNYVEKVIVYQDHCEVVFFFRFDALSDVDSYRFTAEIKRGQLFMLYNNVA